VLGLNLGDQLLGFFIGNRAQAPVLMPFLADLDFETIVQPPNLWFEAPGLKDPDLFLDCLVLVVGKGFVQVSAISNTNSKAGPVRESGHAVRHFVEEQGIGSFDKYAWGAWKTRRCRRFVADRPRCKSCLFQAVDLYV
jgi:hypothetical protein